MDSKEIVSLVESFIKLKPLINNTNFIKEYTHLCYNTYEITLDLQWGVVWLRRDNVGQLNPKDLEYVKELVFQYKESFDLVKSYQEFVQTELRIKKIKRILDE